MVRRCLDLTLFGKPCMLRVAMKILHFISRWILTVIYFTWFFTISGALSTSMPSLLSASSTLCHVSTGFSIKVSFNRCLSLSHSTSFCFLDNSWSNSFRLKGSNVSFCSQKITHHSTSELRRVFLFFFPPKTNTFLDIKDYFPCLYSYR